MKWQILELLILAGRKYFILAGKYIAGTIPVFHVKFAVFFLIDSPVSFILCAL